MTKWKYGNSWEKFQIEQNEVWMEEKTKSMISVYDIFNGVPNYMLQADMVYCDPPWNKGNLTSFYTKAELINENDFDRFSTVLFERIKQIHPKVCYVEIGLQNYKMFLEHMCNIYLSVMYWDITYYKKNPCILIRGGQTETHYDFTGLDDSDTPKIAIRNENFECVADLCTGRGLTAITAFELGKKFVGTELNKRRLAVAIDKIDKLGGIWTIERPSFGT